MLGWLVDSSCTTGMRLYTLRTSHTLEVFMSVTVHNDLSWGLQLCGKKIDPNHRLPITIKSVSVLHNLLLSLQNTSPCIGNNDKCFLELSSLRKGTFMDAKGNCIPLNGSLHYIIYACACI